MTDETLANLLSEDRVFPPPVGFAGSANVSGEVYAAAGRDPEGFWEAAAERLLWERRWERVLDWSGAPVARWFVGGRLNVAVNCVDRHVDAGLGDRTALLFEPESGEPEAVSYAQLRERVVRAANALRAAGVRAGDRVAIYLPMVPEAVVAMLACARIGAPHSVVFAGFSAAALRARLEDVGARVVITADGQFRRGRALPLKDAVDQAVAGTAVERVLVVRRTGGPVAWVAGRDAWWHEAVAAASPADEPAAFDSEHPLFVLYTSGTTGRPKGILHTSGGYLAQAAWTHWAVFDLKPESDVYWCTADVGWVTGHSYVVYGPLANGATVLLYEGTPDTPHTGRWWEIVQRHKVSVLYTAPTAIRTFMKWGAQVPAGYDLSSLRVLGSVGEPINPEAWMWYREVVGGGRCPIVDTWWQTETGAMMIAPLPGVTGCKPGSAMRPLPGVDAAVVDDHGDPVGPGGGGYLVLRRPWPAMLRGIWGDPDRYRDTYWSRFPGKYFAGDGAKLDADSAIWLLGRVDDVMNVSGHRISTTEVESALVAHPDVAEAAVVGAADPTTGQGIVAFAIPRAGAAPDPEDLRRHVAAAIGPIAKPRQVLIVPELPKTRSGKIMRRLLRDIAEHRTIGDTTTLADTTIMDTIAAGLKDSSET